MLTVVCGAGAVYASVPRDVVCFRSAVPNGDISRRHFPWGLSVFLRGQGEETAGSLDGQARSGMSGEGEERPPSR